MIKHISEKEYELIVKTFGSDKVKEIAKYEEKLVLPIAWDNLDELITGSAGQGVPQYSKAHLTINEEVGVNMSPEYRTTMMSENIDFTINVLRKEVVAVNGMNLDKDFTLEVPLELLSKEEIASGEVYYRVIVGKKSRGLDLTFADGSFVQGVDAIIKIGNNTQDLVRFASGTCIYDKDGNVKKLSPINATIYVYPDMVDTLIEPIKSNIKIHTVTYKGEL